jgi:hypothetical protein
MALFALFAVWVALAAFAGVYRLAAPILAHILGE